MPPTFLFMEDDHARLAGQAVGFFNLLYGRLKGLCAYRCAVGWITGQ